MSDIKIGSQVICPVSDGDNEPTMEVGTLVAINSRYATVGFSDNSTVKVGKTKIELFSTPEADEPKMVSKLGDHYVAYKATSGRKSYDIADTTALDLRGKTLDQVYAVACDILVVSTVELKVKYAHLNNGQQRMCLGNRIRKVMKNR